MTNLFLNLLYLIVGAIVGSYGFDYTAARGWGFWKGLAFTLLIGAVVLAALTGVLYSLGFEMVIG